MSLVPHHARTVQRQQRQGLDEIENYLGASSSPGDEAEKTVPRRECSIEIKGGNRG
jgi:hypothetical protein